MPTATFLDMIDATSLVKDPFYLTLSNYLFDETTWPGALPSGGSADRITLSDLFET